LRGNGRAPAPATARQSKRRKPGPPRTRHGPRGTQCTTEGGERGRERHVQAAGAATRARQPGKRASQGAHRAGTRNAGAHPTPEDRRDAPADAGAERSGARQRTTALGGKQWRQGHKGERKTATRRNKQGAQSDDDRGGRPGPRAERRRPVGRGGPQRTRGGGAKESGPSTARDGARGDSRQKRRKRRGGRKEPETGVKRASAAPRRKAENGRRQSARTRWRRDRNGRPAHRARARLRGRRKAAARQARRPDHSRGQPAAGERTEAAAPGRAPATIGAETPKPEELARARQPGAVHTGGKRRTASQRTVQEQAQPACGAGGPKGHGIDPGSRDGRQERGREPTEQCFETRDGPARAAPKWAGRAATRAARAEATRDGQRGNARQTPRRNKRGTAANNGPTSNRTPHQGAEAGPRRVPPRSARRRPDRGRSMAPRDPVSARRRTPGRTGEKTNPRQSAGAPGQQRVGPGGAGPPRA